MHDVGTLYRYATIDVDRLRDNLGDGLSAVRAVQALRAQDRLTFLYLEH